MTGRNFGIAPIITWILGGICLFACFMWFRSFFPPPSNDTFIAHFFLLATLFGISFFGLGHMVCSKVFRTTGAGVEIPVGVGTLALFLSFYLKLTINPIAPVGLMLLGGVVSIKLALSNKNRILTTLNQNQTALFFNVFTIIILTLSFTTFTDSFLLFPLDFDSHMVHVTTPKIILDQGYFFNPDWLRGVWLPQLTRGLYIFILSIAGQNYLKILNVICFVQIGMMFIRGSRGWPAVTISLAMFTLLTTLPEFRRYIVQTNLDTIFALFSVSAFFMLLRHVRNPSLNSLMLIAFLCGFSAGQKHFGLMYSVPILGLASLRFMFDRLDVRQALTRLPLVGASGVLFCATFSPFYLHNVLAGNSLLFPFIGSTVNTYGWNAEDLRLMIESAILRWGYSKTLGGYPLIPLYLLQYPDKYQFFLSHTWADWGMSIAIGVAYLLALASLLLKRMRRPEILVPTLAICLNVVMWYRGSQVIRYLLPILISTLLLVTALLAEWLARAQVGNRLRATIVGVSLVATALLSSRWVIPPLYPLAQSEEDIQTWIKKYQGSDLSAFNWLAQNTPQGKGILNIVDPTGIALFPQIVLCGDWFGRCRYSLFLTTHVELFLTTYVEFKAWPELKGALVSNGLSYIIVNWAMFSPHSKRPSNEAEWNKALPSSTRECLEHLYFDRKFTDVYKVKAACLE